MEVNNRFRLADFYVMVTFEDMFIHVCDKVCVYVHVQRGQSVVKGLLTALFKLHRQNDR